MATYAFKCSACGAAFNLEASLKEKEAGKSEKFTCPECRSKNIKPEFSAANFIKNVFKADNKSCGCSGEKAGRGDNQIEEKAGDCCCGGDKSCC
jgi:putative FmdB family regulatory protein